LSKRDKTDEFFDDFIESMSDLDDEIDLRSVDKKENQEIEEVKKSDEVFEALYTSEDIKDEDNEYFDEEIFDDESMEKFEEEYLGDDELGLDDFSEEILRILNWEPEPPMSSSTHVINEWSSTGWIGLLHIDKILTEAIATGASDVHITADQKISMSRNGEIIRYDGYIIPDGDIMHLLIHEGILSHQQQAELNREYEYDGAYTLRYGPFAGRRTRINVGRSFSKYFIVFRIINDYIPSLEDLAVEDEIVEWTKYPNGLILLCGPTGTGKSTTLASMINNIQLTTRKKIITIEKPIEYIYPDDTESLVVQREVGGDTRGFYEGLTSAMRQNPDIILLGEVRNTEEVTELLRAAETGHLAISTMHTNSVPTTINRIQNLFSGNEQRRIMSTLADTLRGIGNQVLVRDKDDGRFAVREILTINEQIKKLIIAGDVQGIRQYQIDNKSTMEHKLAQAVFDGKCEEIEARKQVVDFELFNKLMR